jgi:hypothetical protein
LPVQTPRHARGEDEIAAIKASIARRVEGEATERDGL